MILILSGCISKVPESTTTTKPINCLNIAKGSGDLVCLLNNESAKDPTWNELIAFLRKDNTDKYDYVPSSFVCADFAEILHNNAEAAGIRAGFVYVEFVDNPENHSLNVFNTTDKGLVFVDVVPNMNNTKHSDKIAYVIEGMEYGLISIDYAKSPDYSFYLSYRAMREAYEKLAKEYNNDLEEYNKEVEEYNAKLAEYEKQLGGRTVISDPAEYERLHRMYLDLVKWKQQLDQEKEILDSKKLQIDQLKEKIGDYSWKPLGVVSEIEIYW